MRRSLLIALVAFGGCAEDDPPCDPPACVHVRDGAVPLEECRIGRTPGDNQQIDPRSADGMTPYFETQGDYTFTEGCLPPDGGVADGGGADGGSADGGSADAACVLTCEHVRDGEVPVEECSIGRTPGDNQQADPRSVDGMTPYFDTQGDYSVVERCAD